MQRSPLWVAIASLLLVASEARAACEESEPDDALSKADDLVEKEAWASAAECFERAALARDNLVLASFRLIGVYERLGRFVDALAAAKVAVASPEWVREAREAAFSLGTTQMEREKWGGALDAFRLSEEAPGRRVVSRHQMGRALIKLGRYRDAIEMLVRAERTETIEGVVESRKGIREDIERYSNALARDTRLERQDRCWFSEVALAYAREQDARRAAQFRALTCEHTFDKTTEDDPPLRTRMRLVAENSQDRNNNAGGELGIRFGGGLGDSAGIIGAEGGAILSGWRVGAVADLYFGAGSPDDFSWAISGRVGYEQASIKKNWPNATQGWFADVQFGYVARRLACSEAPKHCMVGEGSDRTGWLVGAEGGYRLVHFILAGRLVLSSVRQPTLFLSLGITWRSN